MYLPSSEYGRFVKQYGTLNRWDVTDLLSFHIAGSKRNKEQKKIDDFKCMQIGCSIMDDHGDMMMRYTRKEASGESLRFDVSEDTIRKQIPFHFLKMMVLLMAVLLTIAPFYQANADIKDNIREYTKQRYYKNGNRYHESSVDVDSYYYDKHGKLIMVLHKSDDFAAIESEYFDYDSNGRIKGSRSCYTSYAFDAKGNTGETVGLAIVERVYNDHEDIVYEKTTFVYNNGYEEDPSSEIIYAYDYDNHNNVIKKTEWITQYGESFSRTYEYDYVYNKNGTIKTMTSSDGYKCTYKYSGKRIIQIESVQERSDYKTVEKYVYK